MIISCKRLDDESRYVATADTVEVGEINYRTRDDIVTITHTGTDPAHRGHGIAAELTTFALDDIRARGLTVRPLCPYTVAFIDNHPDYADLVAKRR